MWQESRVVARKDVCKSGGNSPSNIALCELKAVVVVCFRWMKGVSRRIRLELSYQKSECCARVRLRLFVRFSTKPSGIGSLLSFLKNRVKKKYKHLFTSIVSRIIKFELPNRTKMI